MRRLHLTAVSTFLFAALAVGCGGEGGSDSPDGSSGMDVGGPGDASADATSDTGSPCEVTRPEPGEPFDRLADYCFFRGQPAKQHLEPSDGVVPYDVRSVLYSDRSEKFRFIVLPDGETIDYDAEAMWAFPDGTIIVKTFFFPHDAREPAEGRRLVETRLLIKNDGEWEPVIYHWNEDQTMARRDILGADVDVEWTDESGSTVTSNYRIPNRNKCKSCHQNNDDLVLLGPRTRQLNRPYDYPTAGEANQLERLDELGLFDESIGDPDELPKLADPKDESLDIEKRARAYLEGNCAHCHQSGGGASNSGLFVGIEQDSPRTLGVCKQTVAAGGGTGGLKYDIKPGHPDESIMIFRMRSNDPEIKMPELPLRTVDTFGANLLSDWIEQMRPKGCDNGE